MPAGHDAADQNATGRKRRLQRKNVREKRSAEPGRRYELSCRGLITAPGKFS
jgi:hypothetical protein